MKETALITGASGGLGAEFAQLFAETGFDLVLVARSEDLLEEIKKKLERDLHVRVHVISKDLSLPTSCREIFEKLQREHVAITALVNNAGFGSYGLFAETDWSQEESMIEVNVRALTELTKLFLPQMLAQKHGRILNVSSAAAFQAGPLMAVYYASKSYVLSFSTALANETHGTGVTVTCLCPGATRTKFDERAHMEESKLFHGDLLDAHQVAIEGVRGCMRGKELVIPGWRQKIVAFSTRLAPRSFAAAVARRLQEREAR